VIEGVVHLADDGVTLIVVATVRSSYASCSMISLGIRTSGAIPF
jgi:hypothetical protein